MHLDHINITKLFPMHQQFCAQFTTRRRWTSNRIYVVQGHNNEIALVEYKLNTSKAIEEVIDPSTDYFPNFCAYYARYEHQTYSQRNDFLHLMLRLIGHQTQQACL